MKHVHSLCACDFFATLSWRRHELLPIWSPADLSLSAGSLCIPCLAAWNRNWGHDAVHPSPTGSHQKLHIKLSVQSVWLRSNFILVTHRFSIMSNVIHSNLITCEWFTTWGWGWSFNGVSNNDNTKSNSCRCFGSECRLFAGFQKTGLLNSRIWFDSFPTTACDCRVSCKSDPF